MDVSGLDHKDWEYGPRGLLTTDGDNTFSAVVAQQGTLAYGSIAPAPTGVDAELQQTVGGVQQEPDAAPAFVVATYSDQPSSGLNPEKWLASLQRYDAYGSLVGSPGSIPVCSVQGCTIGPIALIGSVGVVSYSLSSVMGAYGTTAIDLASGRVVWSAPDTLLIDEDGPLAILQVSTDTGDDHGIEALDGTTGKAAWALPTASHTDGAYVRLAPDLAAVATSSGGNLGGDGTKLNLVDLRTGSIRVSRYGDLSYSEVAFDASTSRVVMTGVAASAADVSPQRTQLETVDLSGKTVFSIPAAQFSALRDPSAIAATGGVMWIEGQNGLDAINEATGIQSPASPQKTGSTDPVSLPTLIDNSIALVTTITNGTQKAGPIALVAASGSPTSAEIAATTNASAN